MSYITINAETAFKELLHVAQRGLTPYMTSSPGVGKSSIVHQIAEYGNLEIIDLRLSQCTPEDLQGFPMRDGDKASFKPFDIFPIEGDELPEGKDGWMIFLDELSSANKQVQAAAYKLILDRMTGSHKLHENVIIMAAGNLVTDKAVVNKMSTALASRVIHYQLECDPKAWMKWAAESQLDHRVIGYISYMPDHLMVFDPDKVETTFRCPRTWEFLARLVDGEEIDNQILPRCAGTIGEGGAVEFITFAQEYDNLPKLPEILANPGATPVPTKLATRYATMTMLSQHVDDSNAATLVDYVKRFDIEQQIIFCRLAAARDNDLPSKSKGFAQYVQSMIRYLQ